VANHQIVHVEIPSPDPEAASRFYADLFGWNIQPVPEMDYIMFQAGDGPGGGLPRLSEYTPIGPLVYVDTDDIDASLAKAESLGATTLAPRTEIPGMGWFAIFQDPSGNRMALYQAMDNSQG
jgi:uncharacterized protein